MFELIVCFKMYISLSSFIELNFECLVYNAHIVSNNETKEYIGMTENSFLKRLDAHNSDQRLPHARKKTELSEYVWNLKDKGITYNIKWTVMEKLPKLKIGDRFCALCVAEKRHILFSNPETCINTRNEFVSKCRHQNKLILSYIKEDSDIDILKHTINTNIEPFTNLEQRPIIKQLPRAKVKKKI